MSQAPVESWAMYDEPDFSPEDFVGRGRHDTRTGPDRALRFLGAATPAVTGFFLLSALLGTGPLTGHLVTGLAVFLFSLLVWILTWGRTVKPA